MKKVIPILNIIYLLSCHLSLAQQLFTENFNYPSAQTLTSNGWSMSGTMNTNPVLVSASGLTFTGYILSGVGKAATLTSNGQDVYKDANGSLSSGSIFASFLLRVDTARRNGDYFFALLATSSQTNYYGRVYARQSSPGYYNLGLAKNADQPVYGMDSFAVGTTSLVVLIYKFVNGSTANDSLTLYNFTSGFPATQPATGRMFTTGGSSVDATTLGRVALRQGAATLAPSVTIDGIRVAGNWADLNTPVSTAPDAATSFVFTATNQTSAVLSWNKAGNYNNTNHTQLVFVKPLNAISTGINNANPAFINADTNFSGSGSVYQNDVLAKCIYKGDSNKVSVSGLNAGTPYFAMILGVSVTDSVYSTAVFANGITNSNGPASVSGMSFSSGSTTTARISWTKPPVYSNANHTTLLFIKEANAINAGVPTLNSNLYTANSDFKGASSKYEFDSNARCAFNADTNFVDISNLTPGTLYFFECYVVSVSDSLYSNPAKINGYTKTPSIGGATNPSFVGISGSTARINWTKPAGYLNATYTTLVFVKAINQVNIGIPTKNGSRYNASSNINFGSIYQNDSLAHCVYKSDTNFVNINGLIAGTLYHAVIFIVRDADSVYAPETLASGSSLGAPPYYSINQINNINPSSGVLDSNNVRATLRGVVYGVNLRTSPGVQFILRDQTGGIMVLNPTKDFGYLVKEGDSIEVQGFLGQNRGWTNITSLDTIIFSGNGKAIKQPDLTSALNESTENNLVKITNLRLVTPMATWPKLNAAYQAYKTGTTDTFTIRIFATTNVGGSAAPSGEFSITGLGGQTSSSFVAPFAFNGYFILPSRAEDIVFVPDTLSPFNLIIPLNNSVIDLKGDTSQTLTVTYTKSKEISGVAPASYHFLLDYPSGTFTSPLLNISLNNGGSDTSASLWYTAIANGLPNLKYGDSLIAKWTIKASTGGSWKLANQSRSIIFKRGAFTGLSAVKISNNIFIYPNPATDYFTIQSPFEPTWVEVSDMSGKMIQTFEPANSYPVNHLPKGLYFVRIKMGEQTLMKKLVLGN
ncbi:MAG: T9SS type A sorting domain-containing protein [Bacteroidota bacterium]|nr:T9SS type A sorting domain-containing protein [Bacteroidota bacterium]